MAPGTPQGPNGPTLQHAVERLEARLQAVVTYGAGGCPTCHDAELRGAIALLKRLLAPAGQPAAVQPAQSAAERAPAWAPGRRRR